jgi:hypothetical protein
VAGTIKNIVPFAGAAVLGEITDTWVRGGSYCLEIAVTLVPSTSWDNLGKATKKAIEQRAFKLCFQKYPQVKFITQKPEYRIGYLRFKVKKVP